MIVYPAPLSSGPSAARMALPSASFGHITPTFLFVGTSGHRVAYARKNCCTPKQKGKVHLTGDGWPGWAPRPKYPASHGTTVEMQGTPAASEASETGFTVSGVEVVSMRSTFCCEIRSPATCAAVVGVDWLSRVTISTE